MSKTAAKTKGRPLAALVDEIYTIREERYDLQRSVKTLKSREDKLEEEVIKELLASKSTTGVAGKVALASLVKKEKLTVEDWDAFYKYVDKNKAWELLQRRLSDEAARERMNDGKIIPGVQKMQIYDLSVTKV